MTLAVGFSPRTDIQTKTRRGATLEGRACALLMGLVRISAEHHIRSGHRITPHSALRSTFISPHPHHAPRIERLHIARRNLRARLVAARERANHDRRRD